MQIRSENLVGRTIAGYRLLEMLGRGGMSLVFLAQRLDNPQDRVAMKILLPSNAVTAEEWLSFQARFHREAQAAYQMHHEHILPILGYGAADDIFYMLMPVITGGTLAQRLAGKQGHMPLEEVAGYLNQLASAVDYAHQQGVIHRDIKPSNVLIDEQGKVYLVDFGIVHLFDKGPYAVDEAPTRLTATGQLYGTPAYMAPERFKGEQAEPATDIYALGVMLYLLVTGQLPFKADSPLLVGMKHLNEMAQSPRLLLPDLPEPAAAAILKALAKEPAGRFATAGALAATFNAGLRGQWTQELFPLPPVVPPALNEAQTLLAPVVPVPEAPAQTHRLVLGSAPASSMGAVPVAKPPPQVRPAPVVYPQPHSRNRFRMLLLAVLVIVGVLLSLLLLPGLQALFSGSATPGPVHQVLPTSTGKTPTHTGITPTPTPGGTPTNGVTPTPTVSPTSSPGTTPTPKVTPTPTPRASLTPTPGASSTSTSGVAPTSSPTPALCLVVACVSYP